MPQTLKTQEDQIFTDLGNEIGTLEDDIQVLADQSALNSTDKKDKIISQYAKVIAVLNDQTMVKNGKCQVIDQLNDALLNEGGCSTAKAKRLRENSTHMVRQSLSNAKKYEGISFPSQADFTAIKEILVDVLEIQTEQDLTVIAKEIKSVSKAQKLAQSVVGKMGKTTHDKKGNPIDARFANALSDEELEEFNRHFSSLMAMRNEQEKVDANAVSNTKKVGKEVLKEEQTKDDNVNTLLDNMSGMASI